MKRPLCALLALALSAVSGVAWSASIVERGYLSLGDGTRLHYTVTRPQGEGRYPVLLKYDGYDAGVYSDPSWNEAGYVTLGVNMRGTGCSQGVFRPLRADQWGADGGEIAEWAARQPWSSGSVGMIGYSFTGVSQLASAAFAGPALKAIAPGNVFLDFYRDSIYPGGIHNGWIPLWIGAGRQFVVGSDTALQAPRDPQCLAHMLLSQTQAAAQTADTQAHPDADAFWQHQPQTYLDRVQIPVLGCINWQDSTIYSRAGNAFRDALNPATTWVVGGNGTHGDCPISRARLQRFFDRYLKGIDNGWERTPRVLLVHEVAGTPPVREALGDDAGAWQSAFPTWNDLDAAIRPLRFHLHGNGLLDLQPPTGVEASRSYAYPLPTANTPADWVGISFWNNPQLPGGDLVYTTPALSEDAEFFGNGSADLWVSSTAPDTDLQITLIEVRPDGQELHVQNGWLRLSRRALDAQRSTALQPVHSHQREDVALLVPGEPVLARIELMPFHHLFRAGSAIRLAIDAPGGWFQILPLPATNAVHHSGEMPSSLVLGWMPGRRAQAPLPACGTLLNQPCRANATPVPEGELSLTSRPDGATRDSGGAVPAVFLLVLMLIVCGRRYCR
ncbi:MAG TPA: CocE/NonD family hydrolase [Solimonas sp.]